MAYSVDGFMVPVPKKKVTFAIILLALIFSGSAFALSASDLDGRWTVTWPNNSRNAIKLTHSGGSVSGIYVSDDGALCPVSVSLVATTGSVTFHVVCPKWDIKMNGVASPNGGAVNGSYLAYGNATGQFAMLKHVEAPQPNTADRHCVDAPQPDGSTWRTCVGDDGKQYCEQCKNTSCSRVVCQ